MFLLRIFGLLALCFSFTAIAFEGEDTTINSKSLLGEPDKRIQERPTPRRRGVECKAPNVWALNISCENRSFCYAVPEDVSLWQPKNPLGQSSWLVIKNMTTEQKVILRWQAGQASLDWPIDKMPIESDVEYSIKITPKGGHSSYHFKMLHQIPADYKMPAEKAAWMKEKGCTVQAEMLEKEQKT
jgi:hypothetical protein